MAEKKRLNIITVFNDEAQYEQLVSGVKDQAGPVEIQLSFVQLDNRSHRFSSAAEAYNYAIENYMDCDVAVFCHQDVRFSAKTIDRVINACLEEPNCLFGAAGVENKGKQNWGKIISSLQGKELNWNPGQSEKTVFVLDECFIAGNRKVFENLRFDEKTCDGWHLYAADFCIQCHLKGIDVKVIDVGVQHLSNGQVDKAFYRCEKKLALKYRREYKLISHTNGWSYTDPFKMVCQRAYRYVKYRWWKLK